MSRKSALIVLILALSSAYGQSSHPVPAPIPGASSAGRFQLVVADISGEGAPAIVLHVMFLLDTQTGQVWRYNNLAGGAHWFKSKDQYEDVNSNSHITGMSPGAFAPVEKIEFVPSPQ